MLKQKVIFINRLAEGGEIQAAAEKNLHFLRHDSEAGQAGWCRNLAAG
jgi:hypothetical protein